MRKVVFSEDCVEVDNGFFFGKGVFETILIKDEPVFLYEHIKRLNKGIKFLNIGEEVSEYQIINLIEEFNIRNCALKIVVTEKNIVLSTRSISYKSGDYLRGFSLKISKINRNSKSKLTYLKSLNYLENILEREETIKNGYDEAIFLNENGFLAEGSMSNVFIIKDNKIFTPSIKCGLLPGVVRGFLVKEYDIIEKEITLEELLTADEIFITNSLLGIMGISKIENRILKENKLTNLIRKEYEAKIEN